MAGAAAILRRMTVLAGIGAEVRADGAGDHSLPFAIALHVASEFLDDAHWLVTDGQAWGYRLFAFENVHVGAADGGGRDA